MESGLKVRNRDFLGQQITESEDFLEQEDFLELWPPNEPWLWRPGGRQDRESRSPLGATVRRTEMTQWFRGDISIIGYVLLLTVLHY